MNLAQKVLQCSSFRMFLPGPPTTLTVLSRLAHVQALVTHLQLYQSTVDAQNKKQCGDSLTGMKVNQISSGGVFGGLHSL